MRSKKALANTLTSLLLQFITIICGFIIPRLIIGTYGSSINGVISSITQFLAFISLLEGGVGGVVRAALYKPLADKDINEISSLIKSTESFFKKISYFFIAYILVMTIAFPYLVNNEFNRIFTTTLVIIIGIATFAQYFFGITYQLLLQADQKLYITSLLQIFTLILNTLVTIILINKGASIHIVKLSSTLFFLIRPIATQLYVKRKYRIITNCQIDNNALKQKWDGIGHHIAYFLHNSTDIVVLTIFTNVDEVSVYSIYLMIVAGIRSLTTTFSSGIEAIFGSMIAKGEEKVLYDNFNIFEFFSFVITTILFTSAALLILPFISVYTRGVSDVNYYRPLFAYILVSAEAIYCIRLPYHSIVLAAGHFKQTKNGAFMEATINIIVSLIFVNSFGLVGVAFGTLCAMIFRTVQYAAYLSHNILNRNIRNFFKRVFVNMLAVIVIIILSRLFSPLIIDNYLIWSIYACKILALSIIIVSLINLFFYYDDMIGLIKIIKRMLTRKTKLNVENKSCTK